MKIFLIVRNGLIGLQKTAQCFIDDDDDDEDDDYDKASNIDDTSYDVGSDDSDVSYIK